MLGIFQKPKITEPQPRQGWVDDLKKTNGEHAWNMFQEGELLVDMYERADALVVRSLIAGVDPDNLEISLHNDLLTIRGAREDVEEMYDDQFYHRECYWGGFRRTIVLPVPVDPNGIRAYFKNGVVIIELPKLNEESHINLINDTEWSEQD
ncbi:Hsp20/alpha crystallin family protein [Candidatus Uhrbacteria bacterium]|nr:Hsp20/alpha crystallin family protein [Candidatus Uhrbacteria bacterium]